MLLENLHVYIDMTQIQERKREIKRKQNPECVVWERQHNIFQRVSLLMSVCRLPPLRELRVMLSLCVSTLATWSLSDSAHSPLDMKPASPSHLHDILVDGYIITINSVMFILLWRYNNNISLNFHRSQPPDIAIYTSVIVSHCISIYTHKRSLWNQLIE